MSEAERQTESAIELRDVVKTFGPITAVDHLDLDVPAGICLGLLGPNGAGKSTTMRLLTGQAIADSGRLRVLEFELPREAKAARAVMGVVPQLDNLDVDVTVEDNLAVFARLYRVPDVAAAVDRALDLARLRERRRDAVDELSGGMRRRLLLARGLVHEPRLVLLDEPTVGLDPQIRTQMWSLIDGLRSRGATILMSTHYIEEAERLADEVAVMAHGKVIARGRPAELIAEHAGPGDRRGLRAARPARRGARRGRVGGARGPAGGPGDRDRRRRAACQRGRPRRRDPPRRLARGRLRPAHRGGGRVSPRARSGTRRLERAAIAGVMSREVANFRTFWKATTFSSVLEPIIYLLAFGLGLGATIVELGRRARLRRVRRHRDGRHRGDLLQRPAGDVRHLRQAPLPAAPTTRSSRRRSTSRSWSRRRCSGSGCAPASTAASR